MHVDVEIIIKGVVIVVEIVDGIAEGISVGGVKGIKVMLADMLGGTAQGARITLGVLQIVGLSSRAEQIKVVLIGERLLERFEQGFDSAFDGSKVGQGLNNLLKTLHLLILCEMDLCELVAVAHLLLEMKDAGVRVAFPFAIIDASGGATIPTLVNLVLASGGTLEIVL